MKKDNVFTLDINSDAARAYLYLNHTDLTDNEYDLFDRLIEAQDGAGFCSLRCIVENREHLDKEIGMARIRTSESEQMRYTIWFLVDLVSLSLKALKEAGGSVSFMEMWPTMKRDILADHHDLFHDEASEYVFGDSDPDDEQ